MDEIMEKDRTEPAGSPQPPHPIARPVLSPEAAKSMDQRSFWNERASNHQLQSWQASRKMSTSAMVYAMRRGCTSNVV
jgi:hypothetical protein